jgi:hypothetical protein
LVLFWYCSIETLRRQVSGSQGIDPDQAHVASRHASRCRARYLGEVPAARPETGARHARTPYRHDGHEIHSSIRVCISSARSNAGTASHRER